MSKYESLGPWLQQFSQEVVTVSFEEIETAIGSRLPPSARSHRNWWGNLAKPTQQPQKAWHEAGMMVAAVDLEDEMVTFKAGATTKRSGQPSIMNGRQALLDLVAEVGEDIAPFFARHAVFLHPQTVSQAASPSGDAIFPIVRASGVNQPGDFGKLSDGTEVMFDDNAAPTWAFLWAARRSRGPDVQFNHAWQASKDPGAYTALWNVFCTPAFLAKLTDTKGSAIGDLVRYHAWRLYGRRPTGSPEPTKPVGYDALVWAPHPEPLDDLAVVLRERLEANRSQRAYACARRLGWRFG